MVWNAGPVEEGGGGAFQCPNYFHRLGHFARSERGALSLCQLSQTNFQNVFFCGVSNVLTSNGVSYYTPVIYVS